MKVLVTGASSFIAGHIILELLNKSYLVHASLRNLEKAEEIKSSLSKYITSKNNLDNLTFFEANLLDENSWLIPIKNVDRVIHVASPLGRNKETKEELVATAKNGTLNILKAAVSAKIPHVIITSSMAAATPEVKVGNVVIEESFWTDINNKELDNYRISKTEAEKAAWDFCKDKDIKITTILPGAVFGPPLSKNSLSSTSIIANIMNGNLACINIPLETVDVRDVATLHILALEKEAISMGNRYLAASERVDMRTVFKILKKHFPEYSKQISKYYLPNFLVRILANLKYELKAFVPMLKRKYTYTNKKAKNHLLWNPRKAEEVIVDTAKRLIDLEIVKLK